MYRDDDISKLFRDHEHKLDEKPPGRAWDKLEAMLDQDKSIQRTKIYRYITTVAAVVAIFAMIFAISIFQQNTPQLAITESQAEAVQDELAFNQQTEQELAEESLEETPEEDKSATTQPAVVKPKVLKKEDAPTVRKPEKTINSEGATSRAANSDRVAETTQPSVTKEEPKAQIMAEEVVQAEEELNEVAVVAAPPPSPRPSPKVGTEPANSKIQAIPEKEVTNASDRYQNAYRLQKNLKDVEISDFAWLIGEWKDNDGSSYEKWEQTGKNELTGTGFLVQKADTLFMEKIELKKSFGKIYFITTVENQEKPVKFELIRFNGNEAVFESKEANFINQVMLKQNDTNNFSTIFQNNEAISKKQEEYLSKRNRVTKARAVRSLKRSN